MIDANRLVRRHLRFGWWTLLLWLTLGIALETMHGFKVGWYLSVGNDTRRMLLTLAHAHGTGLALVHLGFAFTVAHCFGAGLAPRPAAIASPCLTTASILLPAGFLLGGLVVYGGSDPGPGIFLVPIGAVALFVAVLFSALTVRAAEGVPPKPAKQEEPPVDVD